MRKKGLRLMEGAGGAGLMGEEEKLFDFIFALPKKENTDSRKQLSAYFCRVDVE